MASRLKLRSEGQDQKVEAETKISVSRPHYKRLCSFGASSSNNSSVNLFGQGRGLGVSRTERDCGLFSVNAMFSNYCKKRCLKGRSTPATMSKQRSTLLQKRQQCRTSFALKFRPFDKVERCFDIVAGVDRGMSR